MPLDIQDMFTKAGIITDTAAADAAGGVTLADLIKSGPAGVAAADLPRAARNIGSSLGGMLGLDTRDKNEVLADSLKGADLSTIEGINKAAGLIEKTHGGTAALGWKAQALQRLEENYRAQQEMALKAAALAERTSASASPSSRYKVSGDNVFDTETAQWLQPPSAGLTKPEIEKIDPDAYDPQSFVRFRRAVNQATTQQEIDNAGNLLKPSPKDGYAWSPLEGEVDAYGNQAYVERPTGAKLTEVSKSVRAANEAGRQQREQSAHVVGIMDKMIDSVETGKTATGMKGIALQVLPGTKNYALKGDLDVVLANLGYDALLAAKNSSDTGASGFGQLTQKELELLQQLEQDLKVGLDKETLVARLQDVKNTFDNASKRAKTDWTVDQYIGIEKPEPVVVEAAPVSSGTTPEDIAAERRKREQARERGI